MAAVSFLAVSYKNKSFEALFSGTEINTFPYVLTTPEKKYIMAFKENQLDEVLNLLGLDRSNIVDQIDTERPNVKLLQFNTIYEYSIEYDSSVNQTIQNAIDSVFIAIYKKYPTMGFSVHFTNNASSLNQEWEYTHPNDLHIFLASFGSSTGYASEIHDVTQPPIDTMSNFMIPAYVSSDAIIKIGDIPVAMIKGNKIIMMLYLAKYLGTSAESTSAMQFLYKSLVAVFDYIKYNPDIFRKLIDLEKEYKFMEFLSKLVSKRSESNIKRLKEVQTQLPAVMTQLTDLVNEQDYLNRILNAIDVDGEKERLIKEIGIIRKSSDVKDIVFQEDALMINMKHVMFPYYEEKDKSGKEMILHCGELTIMLPFDSKKEILVLRSENNTYPDHMRDIFKQLSCPHPNIFNVGRLCYGNTAETFAQLRGLFDISSIFIMINNFVHLYNPKSPTISPSLFPRTTLEEATELYNKMYPDGQTTAELVSYSDSSES